MFYYQPNDPNCKSVTGAVAANQAFCLRLSPLGEASMAGVTVRFVREEDQKTIEVNATLLSNGVWQMDCAISEEGLYFYQFLGQPGGHPLHTSLENIPHDGRHNQGAMRAMHPLLVYLPQKETPSPVTWAKGAVVYQIFPDRFCITGRPDPTKAKNPRTIHQSPLERPLFVQDEPEYAATDFFGGTLKGITSRLDYLKELGVTVLYFNPMFEAASNHRYNTGDYFEIDPFLGTKEDFAAMCRKAHALGMRVILDGVFSHTGSDSRYFNKEGHYDTLGAYQSDQSPYASWFSFGQTRDDYASWWGFKTLPNVNETAPAYMEFICGENGVLRHWLRLGADGWRLDVADELPDEFLEAVRCAIKQERPDAWLLGEVWENAALKHSYGARRKFLQGKQLDGVMNYPWRSGIIESLLQQSPDPLAYAIWDLQETYPPEALYLGMNLLGTHDTPRILTVLAGLGDVPKDWQPEYRMTAQNYATAAHRLRLAMGVQYFLPGMPSIYYGDEAGMEGFADPWNRRCFPWGSRDLALTDFVKKLGALRAKIAPLLDGKFACRLISLAAAPAQDPAAPPAATRLLCLTYEGERGNFVLLYNPTPAPICCPAALCPCQTLTAFRPFFPSAPPPSNPKGNICCPPALACG